MSKDEVINYLFNKGISLDYNKPMELSEIKRKGESWQRQVYNNIIATNNLVNIQQVKGSDLEIVDTDKYDYLMTYSFPCQDLSLAGKGKGMADTSTRSGMLWEVERILDECYKLGSLPQILLMENVTQVVGTKNIKHFQKWRRKLEDLGYQSYVQNINATEYGTPQTRDRTFMLSILGQYNYVFPKSIQLKLRLKDMLDDEVDEKYYLSKVLNMGFKENYIQYDNSCKGYNSQAMRAYYQDGLCPTLPARNGGDKSQVVLEDKQVLLDGIGERCFGNQDRQGNGVVVKKDTENYIEWQEKGKLDIDCRAWKEDKVISTVTTDGKSKVLQNDLRIRKLTPKECFRLMGVKDEDFENIAKNQSNSSLYHLAGDSIVTTVLMAILGKLLGIDYELKINELLEELTKESKCDNESRFNRFRQ